MMRPGNAFITVAAVLVGSLLAGAPPWPWGRLAAACVTAFAFAAAGNVRNDLTDVEVDRRAHPTRPLVTGAVSPRLARHLALLLYALSLAAAAWISVPALALVLFAVPVMEGYERWGKARGLPGNLAIGLLTAAPFVLGGLVVDRVGPALLAVAGLAGLATAGREVLKDVEDAEADRGARRTLPMRVGAARASAVAAAFLGAAVLLSPSPWLLESVLGWPYLPAVSVADGCFLAAAWVGRARPARGQRLAKAGMAFALVALVLGRAQSGGVL